MSENMIDLLAVFDLEPIEVNLFRGINPSSGSPWVFGGQIIGQSMVAATRRVDSRLPHSLHCHFIRAGDPRASIVYQVECLREDECSSIRRVTGIQHGDAIFSTMISFTDEQKGTFDFQHKMDKVPAPEKLTTEQLSKQKMGFEAPEFIRRRYAIEMRPVEIGRYFGKKVDDGRTHIWIRIATRLPEDRALHMCALAYASDYSLLDTVMARYGRAPFDKQMMPASLDHAMWFHRPFRADDWLLCAQDSPSAQDGRGLARGLIYKRDGTLIASIAQEGSVRKRRRA